MYRAGHVVFFKAINHKNPQILQKISFNKTILFVPFFKQLVPTYRIWCLAHISTRLFDYGVQ